MIMELKKAVQKAVDYSHIDQLYHDAEHGIYINDPAKQVVNWNKLQKRNRIRRKESNTFYVLIYAHETDIQIIGLYKYHKAAVWHMKKMYDTLSKNKILDCHNFSSWGAYIEGNDNHTWSIEKCSTDEIETNNSYPSIKYETKNNDTAKQISMRRFTNKELIETFSKILSRTELRDYKIKHILKVPYIFKEDDNIIENAAILIQDKLLESNVEIIPSNNCTSNWYVNMNSARAAFKEDF